MCNANESWLTTCNRFSSKTHLNTRWKHAFCLTRSISAILYIICREPLSVCGRLPDLLEEVRCLHLLFPEMEKKLNMWECVIPAPVNQIRQYYSITRRHIYGPLLMSSWVSLQQTDVQTAANETESSASHHEAWHTITFFKSSEVKLSYQLVSLYHLLQPLILKLADNKSNAARICCFPWRELHWI